MYSARQLTVRSLPRIAAAAVLAVLPPASSRAQTAVWQDNANGQSFATYTWPDNNNWSQQQVIGPDPGGGGDVVLQPSNWSTPFYPDNGNGGVASFDVVIPSVGGSPLLDVKATIGTLSLDAGATLNTQGGTTLTVAGGVLNNNGTINVNAVVTPDVAALSFSSDATISGNGTIVMNSPPGATFNRAQINTPVGVTITNGAGHTIRGGGHIVAAFVNNGSIIAEHGIPSFLLFRSSTNNGLLKASAGATMQTAEQVVITQGAGGQVLADGGTFQIGQGSRVIGGTLSTLNDGVIRTSGNGYLTSVTNNGTFRIQGNGEWTTCTNNGTVNVMTSGGQLRILGGALTNNGTININLPEGSLSSVGGMNAGAHTTIDGLGTIVLHTNAHVSGATGQVLTNGAGHTIRGTATFFNGFGGMVNNGLLLAENGNITISPDSTARFANNGTLSVDAGRTMTVNLLTTNVAGRLTAGTYLVRGTLAMAPLHTNDGSITLDGAGSVIQSNSGPTILLHNALRNNTGSLTVTNGRTYSTGASTFTNSGMITVGPGGSSFTVNVPFTWTGGTITGAGPFTAAAGATISNAVIKSGDGMLKVIGALAINAGAELDLTDNDLLVEYSGASPEDQIRQWVKDGLALGTGITTLDTGDTVLAIVDNAEWNQTDFNDISIQPNTIVGKYTYYGDANLDGAVTSDDYVAIDVGLGEGNSWIEGDFDMDGQVSSDDYVAIDVNLGKGADEPGALAELKAEMIAVHAAQFGEEYLAKLAAAEAYGFAAVIVPEPRAAIGAALAWAMTIRRRQRTTGQHCLCD